MAENPRVVGGIYPSEPAPVASSGLGGGFVEFLLTSNGHAAPVRRAHTPAPAYAALAPAEPALAPAEPRPEREPAPQFRRQEVDYASPERPGTLVIDTPNKHLYLVEPDGRAMRYGVGVGRPGFEWAGVKRVSRKAEWPDWTPPPEMMLRRPDLPAHMDGGPENPLGARALYLGSSMYRIHGTNEPWTIGQSVSSGCIRMMNDDVIDLYDRVKVGSKVIVM